jgi:hypothetical protein
MELWMWVLIAGGIVIVGLVALVGVPWARRRVAERRRHRRELRERFGQEYGRVVGEHGRKRGERVLDERLESYEDLEPQSLRPAVREEHTETWRELQFGFVDSPERSVREAEHLVVSVMDERGYPTDDVTVRADALSIEDPELATAYRAAHRAFRSADRGEAALHQLLGAFLVYRELLEYLLDRPKREQTVFDADPPRPDPADPVVADGARAASSQ